MFLLYGGTYASRYNLIVNCVKQKRPKKVLELCFGDTLLAEFCRKNKIEWQGIDHNKSFIAHARKKGHNVLQRNITKIQDLPKADMIVISGALYHFHDTIDQLFERILESTNQVLISEHVIPFNTSKGLLGYIGGIISNAGNRNEPFRYNKVSLGELMKRLSLKYHLKCQYIGHCKWDDVYLISPAA
jgi:hypothetical protein